MTLWNVMLRRSFIFFPFFKYLSKHVLSTIFRPVFYYFHILQKCDIDGFCIHAHSPHLFFYFSPFRVVEHLSYIYAVIEDYIGNNFSALFPIHEIDFFRLHKQIHEYLLYFCKTLIFRLTRRNERS